MSSILIVAIATLLAVFYLMRWKAPGSRPAISDDDSRGWFTVETLTGDGDYVGMGILKLTGDGDRVEGDLRRLIDDGLTSLIGKGCHTILVDARELAWLTADAWSVLLQDLHRLRDVGGDVILWGLQPEVRAFLEELRLVDKLRIVEGDSLGDVCNEIVDSRQRPVSSAPSPRRCFLTLEREQEIPIVVVKGALREEELPPFVKAIEKSLSNRSQVLVDAAELVSASSSTLGTLVKLGNEARDSGKDIALVAAGPVKAMIEVIGLQAFFSMFSSRQEALAALGGGGNTGRTGPNA